MRGRGKEGREYALRVYWERVLGKGCYEGLQVRGGGAGRSRGGREGERHWQGLMAR